MTVAPFANADVQRATSRGKSLLTYIGAACSARTIYRLNASMNFLEVGSWMRRRNLQLPRREKNRYGVFDLVARELRDKQVLYLEFGVSAGWSMRYWSRLLRNPHARLHGFDTFEGLPLAWLPSVGQGSFSTGGQAPQIADERITFFKGLFSETLPGYRWPDHEVLVVNIDADLYASASYVLSSLRERLVPGSVLYFDEFHHRCDELRAFDEFLTETEMEFSVIGATRDLAGVAFKRER